MLEVMVVKTFARAILIKCWRIITVLQYSSSLSTPIFLNATQELHLILPCLNYRKKIRINNKYFLWVDLSNMANLQICPHHLKLTLSSNSFTIWWLESHLRERRRKVFLRLIMARDIMKSVREFRLSKVIVKCLKWTSIEDPGNHLLISNRN